MRLSELTSKVWANSVAVFVKAHLARKKNRFTALRSYRVAQAKLLGSI